MRNAAEWALVPARGRAVSGLSNWGAWTMLHLRKLIADKRGVTAIEYALIASLISVAAIAGYHNLGDKVGNSFADIEQNLDGKL
jgi:pilus assembly protein Flp/PilA